MELDLKQLEQSGGLYTGLPVKKEIEWERVSDEGEVETLKYDIFVRRLPFGELERILKSDSYTAQLICSGVRLGKNGKESLSYDQALMLDPALAGAMAKAVNDVNDRKKKQSNQTSESGSNSSSTELAVKQ